MLVRLREPWAPQLMRRLDPKRAQAWELELLDVFRQGSVWLESRTLHTAEGDQLHHDVHFQVRDPLKKFHEQVYRWIADLYMDPFGKVARWVKEGKMLPQPYPHEDLGLRVTIRHEEYFLLPRSIDHVQGVTRFIAALYSRCPDSVLGSG